MKIIDDKNIYNILIKSLSFINNKIIEHGKKTAYIVLKMLENDKSISKKELQNICILSLLHDIGAFKTELIDDDFEFDTYHTWDHSIYGYLFLKECSPLSDICESIRYHHEPFNELNKNQHISSIIMLADTIDIHCIVKNNIKFLTSTFKETNHYPAMKKNVTKFINIDNKHHIINKIVDQTYNIELLSFFENAEFTQNESDRYLNMLTYTLDFKSEHHCIHSFFTSSISKDISVYMGLDDDDIKKAEYAGLLHDIGKLSTPFDILEKPIKLSSNEVSIYKNHVNITHDILKDNVIDDVCTIASNHHEFINGKGYPNGLILSQLSTLDKILIVANILSSLTLKKGYKTRYSKKQIIAELAELSKASIISREVVAVVIQHYDSIIKNANNNSSIANEKLENIMHNYFIILKQHTNAYLL